MTGDDPRRRDPLADRFPRDLDPDRDGDLEALFVKCPPRPADPRTIDRLTARATERLKKRIRTRRARRRTVLVATAVASAAALVVLARWPLPEVEAPGDHPLIVEQPAERSRRAEPLVAPQPPTETRAVPSVPSAAPSPVATASKALETTIELRSNRREILRELRRGGPEVVEPLVLALRTAGETSLAAAQLLASLATAEADAAARQLLEEGLEDGVEDGLPARTAEVLVEELLRRRDRAGRRLVRRLLEAPPVGGLIVRLIGEERSAWADDLLGEASGSPSMPLSAEAIGLLSHRRPRKAAAAFWKAAESFTAASSPPTEGAGTGPSEGLTDFLRETLPRLSARALDHLGEDVRRRSPSTRTGPWREALPASLGRSGRREAWPLLVALVATGGARPVVLRAFGALGDERAVPMLERYVLLEDDRAEAAIRALAAIPDTAGVHALLKIYLSMGSAGQLVPRRRTLLASSLRDRGARALAELRARLARLPDQRTLGALIELFPEAAGDELARLLPNVDRRGRPQVFRALARLGTAEAISILIDALEDPSCRSLARQSLTGIARRDLGSRPESWKEWLRDHDPGARRRADFSPGPFEPGPLHDRTGAAPVLALKTHPHHQEEA